MARISWTLALAGAGVLVFHLLALPLPFLLGPMFACLAGALTGLRLSDSGLVGTGMRTVLGVAVGTAITPELVARLPGMAYSVACVPIYVLMIGLLGYPYFRRVWGFDGPTAFYAAMPGSFQDMVIFGEEAGADVTRLSLVHATRLLVVVTVVPFAISRIYGEALDHPAGAALADVPVSSLLLMLVAAIGGWQVARLVGLFGSVILGPMIVAAILTLSGLLQEGPPEAVMLAAQFFIGTSIGAKFTAIESRQLGTDVAAGLGFCCILAVLSLGAAEAVALAGWAPPLEAFLSFAPGGQAEMTVLTLVAGADLAFVVTHHVLRVVLVVIGAPLLGRPLGWKRSDES